ncbi:MAG: Ca-activated chloride channel [Thermoleophilaceae bacterium]|nr:Ca-activated chloride channel [Thermoleophilaceae bacterium]
MNFGHPYFLLGLLLVPLLVAAQMASRRRARRYAVRFTAVPALKAAAAASPRAWTRHIPAALLLGAMASLVFALAKPQRTVAVPVERGSIMLVTDHSRSMQATDVVPDRLRAAQAAAHRFLSEVPSAVRVGVVTFSNSADAVQAPSSDHSEAGRVVDAQVADGATATGDALQVALDTLSADRVNGKRPPAAIVLLSDGKTTTGRDPVEVARTAGRLHIPIFTVALGTADATVPNPGFGPPLPVPPDPGTLAEIAQASGGRAFTAEDSSRLASIYKALGSQLGTKNVQREVTSSFALIGLGLLLGGAALSVRSRGRLP